MKSWKYIFIGFIVLWAIVIVWNFLVGLFIDKYKWRLTYRSRTWEKVYLKKWADGIYSDRDGYIIHNPTYCWLRWETSRAWRDGIYDWEDWYNQEAGCIVNLQQTFYLNDEWWSYYRNEIYGGYSRISMWTWWIIFSYLPDQPDYSIEWYQVGNKFFLYGKELIWVRSINELRFLVFPRPSFGHSGEVFFITDKRHIWMNDWSGIHLLWAYSESKFRVKDGVFIYDNQCYHTETGEKMIACNPNNIVYVWVSRYKYKVDINGLIKTESGIINSQNDIAFSDWHHEYNYYWVFLR